MYDIVTKYVIYAIRYQAEYVQLTINSIVELFLTLNLLTSLTNNLYDTISNAAYYYTLGLLQP